MDDTLRIEMTTQEKADAGQQLAVWIAERDALKEQRSKAMSDAAEDIETLEASINELATDLREGRKEKRQADLFHDEKPSPAEVPGLLAAVAVAAGDVPAVSEEAVEDVMDALGAPAPDPAFLRGKGRRGKAKNQDPKEAHSFSSTGGKLGLCWCGLPRAASIHPDDDGGGAQTSAGAGA